jgi:hypothetical protein
MDLESLLSSLPDNVKRKIEVLSTPNATPPASRPEASTDELLRAVGDAPALVAHAARAAPSAALVAGSYGTSPPLSITLPPLRQGRGAAVLDRVLEPSAVAVRRIAGPLRMLKMG